MSFVLCALAFVSCCSRVLVAIGLVACYLSGSTPLPADSCTIEKVNLNTYSIIARGERPGSGVLRRMSSAIKRTCEMVKQLRTQGRPWLEIQDELEKAGIKQGDYRPLYFGCETAPYRLRFIPKQEPRILSREFDEELARLAGEHSLVVQMRCTGYNLFMDTGKPEGNLQRIRKALRLSHRTEWLQALWVDKYCIEADRPDLPGVPEALEDIGSRLYGTTAR